MIQQSDQSNSQFEVNMNTTKSTSFGHTGQRSTFSNIHVNRGTTHIFYKTKMCHKFLEGTYRNASGCTYAHGPSDLREPPPNWQELVIDNNNSNNNNNNNSSRGGNIWNDDEKIIHQMRLCRKFCNGHECPYVEKCAFIHESPAKFKIEAVTDCGRTRESSVINIQIVAVDYGQSKTEAGQMYGKWETNGHNMFADKCHFDHGLPELHNPIGHAGGSVATPMICGPATEPLVAGSATPVIVVQQAIGKGFLKLANRKLNGIYGDWIDDEEEEDDQS
ncbi:zinc finger CCCH domain-containing protein 39-like [Bidens hawaiensis]|uniref:zinc finger CCCH domain-containing protein 39-like n=1 Tax=Bidens hawaiensis TaxID=980011 RepID=UPI00404B8BC8